MVNWLWGAVCMAICFVVLSYSPLRWVFLIIGVVDVVMANIEYVKLRRRVEMLEDRNKCQDKVNHEIVNALNINTACWKELCKTMEDDVK